MHYKLGPLNGWVYSTFIEAKCVLQVGCQSSCKFKLTSLLCGKFYLATNLHVVTIILLVKSYLLKGVREKRPI